jgi:hypothetical protein
MSIGGARAGSPLVPLARQRVVAASGGFQFDHQGSRPSPSHLVRRDTPTQLADVVLFGYDTRAMVSRAQEYPRVP